MNYASLSLEQEFALRILSTQIQKNTNVAQLQDELIGLFEKVLIKHQNLKDAYSFPREDEGELALSLRACEALVSELEQEATIICSCIPFIRDNHDIEKLQALLIEANEISVMQRNYTNFISQYI